MSGKQRTGDIRISYTAALDAAIASASPTERADSPHATALRELREDRAFLLAERVRTLEGLLLKVSDALSPSLGIPLYAYADNQAANVMAYAIGEAVELIDDEFKRKRA